MTVEFDHLFICTAVNAPEADQLVAFGLTEGTSSIHPGQGTSNRRFFFRNGMLEFLWVHDESEVQSPIITPTKLGERWQYRSTEYSPFGICFRPSKQNTVTQLPMATWKYHPPYLPPALHIDIASDTGNSEPMLFLLPFGSRPDAMPIERHQPLIHSCGFGEITAVRITLPQCELMSCAVQAVQEAGLISFYTGTEHLAEIEFDCGGEGKSLDFQPTLPLRFQW